MPVWHAEKIEVTTDKDLANKLLQEGWFLVDFVATPRKEFLFLLCFFDELRYSRIMEQRNGQKAL